MSLSLTIYESKCLIRDKTGPYLEALKPYISPYLYDIFVDFYFNGKSFSRIAKERHISSYGVQQRLYTTEKRIEKLMAFLDHKDDTAVIRPPDTSSYIEHLMLPTRVERALQHKDIYSIQDLSNYTLQDILMFPGISLKGLRALLVTLKNAGLEFMDTFKESDDKFLFYTMTKRISLDDLLASISSE
ncbi:hypothetical protein [Anaerosolibacter sp.]|uniref:hypothetical protein n=1 Tax=Anaerosolibacter sp. TaxID=1872527 RepID=UPI0039EF4517